MFSEHDKIYMSLRQSRYFRLQSDVTIQKLMVLSQIREYPKGYMILQQGQRNNEIFVIVSGGISVIVDGKRIYDLQRKGDIFGEMSVITGDLCSATIVAKSELQVVTISAELLKTIQEDSSHELHYLFYQWFAIVLSEKLQLTSTKAKQYEELYHQRNADIMEAKQLQQEAIDDNMTSIPGLHLTLKAEFADILGGDFYAVFNLGQGRYGILIGDVAGHGTAAALVSVCILGIFRYFSHEVFSSEEMLNKINNMACMAIPRNRFATLFYAIYDTATYHLTYTNAGHHPALLLREGSFNFLDQSSGMPIGAFNSDIAGFSEMTIQLNPGDRLMLFTDAVFECFPDSHHNINTQLNMLRAFVEDHGELPSPVLAEAVYNYGRTFTGGEYPDDFTLMIFELEKALPSHS